MNAFAPRRSTEPQISEAITLGWRIATLYSLRASELPSAPPDNLLPMRRSLPAAERLVLELRAADGDAGRLGIGLEPAALDELVELAWHAPDSDEAEDAFRARIRAWHIELQTRLWADHEPTGKAYELGSFISDTSNRVVLELRRPGDPSGHVTRELREVFAERRVERVKRLLDDLQARIDPAAVRIVKQHLERWKDAAVEREATCTTRADLEPLDSQAVTWFQLVSGDKEPEAYIDHEDRAKVRGAMLSRTVRSYACNARCVVAAVLALVALAALAFLLFPALRKDGQITNLVVFATPIAGALGVSLASVGRTVRRSLDARAELLWNTALVEVISQKTLHVDALLPAPPPRRAWHPTPAPLRSWTVVQRDRVA
jgi:hypothetical protein